MRGTGHGSSPSDPITGYLDQLRAGLRVAPVEAELILAEAEDHLRETAAAAMAIGMTEREAQEAAISSFGPVRAVVRAHRDRLAPLGDAAMAAWKLTSLLLLTSGSSGLATAAIFGIQAHVLTLPSGVQAQVVVTSNAFPWLVWAVSAISGATLLAGYRLALRIRRRRGRERALLAGFFPMVAASFFGAIALALMVLNVSGTAAKVDSGLAVAAYLALAVCYAIRMWRMLRQGRGPASIRWAPR
jgi:hypothetical protein